MALKAVLSKDEHAKLPEHFRSEYVERDGKMFLDVTTVEDGDKRYAMQDVGKLQRALDAEREISRKQATQLQAVEGIDPTAAREALAKIAELKNGKQDDKTREQIEAIRKELETQHKKVVGDYETKTGKLEAQLKKELVTSRLSAAIGKHMEGDPDALLPLFEPFTRVDLNDKGEYVPRVIDRSGNLRYSTRGGETVEMTLEDLVTSSRDQPTFARMYKGSGQSGTGASTQRGTTVINGTDKRSPQEKLKAGFSQ